MPFKATDCVLVFLSFALAAVLTPLVRAAARRWNVIAQPRPDRWHKQPTALLGGVAVFLTVTVILVASGLRTPQALMVLAGSTLLFLVGLVDDLFHVRPYQKLVGQMGAAGLVIFSGLVMPWTGVPAVDVAITAFWLVGITNAVNMLDNMDGLAAGIAAIGATFLALHFLANGQTAEMLMLSTFAAALVGFLVYNSNPASIFMGDCGSLFVGFFLAGSALFCATGERAHAPLPVLAVPVLILLVPIFDTTLVTVSRKLAGRAASQGGRDHTSHRLVALGMSERRAVSVLYGCGVLSGAIALLVRELSLDAALAVLTTVAVVSTLLGSYLGAVPVYSVPAQPARKKRFASMVAGLSRRRRVFEVLLDVVLIVLSYDVAYGLLHGAIFDNGAWHGFLKTLSILVFVKLATFLAMGVYRGIWRYISVEDLVVYVKASLLGSALSAAAVLLVFGLRGFSPSVFVLDGLILLLTLTGSRMTFRILRKAFPPTAMENNRRRALIYGAGDAGDLLLRELLNNPARRCDPVGFIDDDHLKQGKHIHGLRVFGGNGTLLGTIRQHRIDEVIISSEKLTHERTQQLVHDCRKAHVTVRRMNIQLEPLGDDTETEYR